MINDINLNKKFQLAKETPTEFSLTEVQTIIVSLPNLTSMNIKDFNYSDLLTIKNMSMLFIPISIAISFFVINDLKDQNKFIEHLAPLTSIQTNHISTNDKDLFELNNFAQIEYKDTKDKPGDIANPKSRVHQSEVLTINQKSLKIEPSESVFKKPIPLSKKPPINNTDSNKTKTLDVLEPAQKQNSEYIVPDFSDKTMRQLKRKLYKELLSDNIIPFKDVYVLIHLQRDQIIVNDQILNESLYLKYREITRKVGSGKFRMIEMDAPYIKIGDFKEEGFKGSGLGRFSLERPLQSDNNSLFDKEEADKDNRESIFDNERKMLSEFSKSILSNSLINHGKPCLFSVNIKGPKLKRLFDSLHKDLLADGFIKSSQDLVLINLPKDQIWINGVKLKGDLSESYMTLIDSYNIKHGGRRMIKLSEHTIAVGDFIGNDFTGTTADYNFLK